MLVSAEDRAAATTSDTGAGPENWQAERRPVEKVAVTSLRASASPRISGENPEHIRALAETDAELPPIIVHRPTMRVIDGMHRLRAAELRDRAEIEVRFFDGSETDAFILAVKANIAHGLPLSLADRKAAAARIITTNPQWSDRLIASKAGIAAKTVGTLRDRAGETIPAPSARIGQDGRARPVSSTEGRLIASELMTDNPHLSLRQIARAAGISPETVRDVRGRLSRGEDPVLPKQRSWKRTPKKPEAPQQPEAKKAPVEPEPTPIEDLPAVVHQLRNDPALRFSEAGRALLKMLDAHTVVNQKFDSIADNVPAHCRGTVASAARECAQVWRSFANRLDDDTTTA